MRISFGLGFAVGGPLGGGADDGPGLLLGQCQHLVDHGAEVTEGGLVDLRGPFPQVTELAADLRQLAVQVLDLVDRPASVGRERRDLGLHLREVVVDLPLVVAAQRDFEALP